MKKKTAGQKAAKIIFWLVILAIAGFSGFLDFEDLADPKLKFIPQWVGFLAIAILMGGRWIAHKINWSFFIR